MVLSGKHITNLNCVLKDIKSDVFINFICSNHRGLTIITNKVASPSNLSIVEKYVKSAESIDSNNVQSACLSQSKSYLKILGVLYNIYFVSKLYIIKVSFKLDMAIV